MGAKVRLSEQKTKFYLSFLEREYLRTKFKGSNFFGTTMLNRAKYLNKSIVESKIVHIFAISK